MHVCAGQVVLFVLCTVVFGIPHPAPSGPRSWPTPTSHKAPAIMISEAAPKSLRIPWPDQIPQSTHVIVHRATSSSSSVAAAPTNTGLDNGLGQIVVTSTKMSTLPPAVCGFVPYWNETSSVIEIVGCNGSSNAITGVSTFVYDDNQTCETSNGQFFCRRTPIGSIVTGCIDVSTVDTYMESWSSSVTTFYDTLYSTYSEQIVSTSWTEELITSAAFQISYTTSASIYTVTYETYISSISQYTVVTSTTADSTVTSYELSNQTISEDPLQLTCYPEDFYTPAVCQTFVAGNVEGYQCLTSIEQGFGTTVLSGQTITMLGIDELRSAYPSMTLTFTAGQSGTSTWLAFSTMYPTMTLSGPSAASSSPSVYLNLIKSNPPSCVSALNTTCTTLFDAARRCWSEAFPPGPQGCYCEALVSMNCTELCDSNPKDRNGYYEWVMGLCSSNNATGNFSANWPEMVNRTTMVYEDMFPWPWHLQPNSTNPPSKNYTCPTMSSKLGSFAAINGIIAFSVPFLGSRSLIHKLTRGYLGRPGSPMWPYTALLAAGLNMVATAINAAVATRARNFAASVSVRELFLLWSTQPRTAWVATAFARLQADKTAYLAVAMSTLLAEFLLQVVGAVDLVRTIQFAASRGFYMAEGLRFAPAHVWALLMYAGALLWLLSAAFFFIYTFHTYVMVKPRAFDMFLIGPWRCFIKPYVANPIAEYSAKRKHQRAIPPLVIAPGMPSSFPPNLQQSGNDHEAIESSDTDTLDDPPQHFGTFRASVVVPPSQEMSLDEALRSMGTGTDVIIKVSMAGVVLVIPFIGQWLFWIGFVGLFGDRYCPPDIVSMTAVWIIFSALGVFSGAAL